MVLKLKKYYIIRKNDLLRILPVPSCSVYTAIVLTWIGVYLRPRIKGLILFLLFFIFLESFTKKDFANQLIKKNPHGDFSPFSQLSLENSDKINLFSGLAPHISNYEFFFVCYYVLFIKKLFLIKPFKSAEGARNPPASTILIINSLSLHIQHLLPLSYFCLVQTPANRMFFFDNSLFDFYVRVVYPPLALQGQTRTLLRFWQNFLINAEGLNNPPVSTHKNPIPVMLGLKPNTGSNLTLTLTLCPGDHQYTAQITLFKRAVAIEQNFFFLTQHEVNFPISFNFSLGFFFAQRQLLTDTLNTGAFLLNKATYFAIIALHKQYHTERLLLHALETYYNQIFFSPTINAQSFFAALGDVFRFVGYIKFWLALSQNELQKLYLFNACLLGAYNSDIRLEVSSNQRYALKLFPYVSWIVYSACRKNPRKKWSYLFGGGFTQNIFSHGFRNLKPTPVVLPLVRSIEHGKLAPTAAQTDHAFTLFAQFISQTTRFTAAKISPNSSGLIWSYLHQYTLYTYFDKAPAVDTKLLLSRRPNSLKALKTFGWWSENDVLELLRSLPETNFFHYPSIRSKTLYKNLTLPLILQAVLFFFTHHISEKWYLEKKNKHFLFFLYKWTNRKLPLRKRKNVNFYGYQFQLIFYLINFISNQAPTLRRRRNIDVLCWFKTQPFLFTLVKILVKYDYNKTQPSRFSLNQIFGILKHIMLALITKTNIERNFSFFYQLAPLLQSMLPHVGKDNNPMTHGGSSYNFIENHERPVQIILLHNLIVNLLYFHLITFIFSPQYSSLTKQYQALTAGATFIKKNTKLLKNKTPQDYFNLYSGLGLTFNLVYRPMGDILHIVVAETWEGLTAADTAYWHGEYLSSSLTSDSVVYYLTGFVGRSFGSPTKLFRPKNVYSADALKNVMTAVNAPLTLIAKHKQRQRNHVKL